MITGVGGQDGSYLAELLIAHGYEVHGLLRPGGCRERLTHLLGLGESAERLRLHEIDVLDADGVRDVVERVLPGELYHLASRSHVGESFATPQATVEVIALGTLNVLESVRRLGERQPIRVCQAASSELFGAAQESPQHERTPFRPRSPYACAKAYAFLQTASYREVHGVFACNAISFNHESPRRRESFVTRKITRAAGRIREGLQRRLQLGNLDTRRDWGHARDHVRAMWLMLQQPAPDDYVVATGESHSVREFLEAAFTRLGLDWREHVEVDPACFRPGDINNVRGDSRRARERLGWKPEVTFEQLVAEMVDHDLALAVEERRGR